MQSREAIEAGTALLGNLLNHWNSLTYTESEEIVPIAYAQARFLESIALSLATLTELAQKPVYEIQVESKLEQGVTRAEIAEAFRKLDALPGRR